MSLSILKLSRLNWKPYPAYKDSVVDWLGKIPAHWEIKRLKRLFRVVNGSTPKSGEPDYWDGDIPWVTPDDLGQLSGPELSRPARYITRKGYESCGTTLVPEGSLVLSTRAPIGHLAIAGVSLCTNQGCRSLVSSRQESRKYYYYQLLAARPELESLGDGSTFKELAKGSLESVFLLEPSPQEQRAIAAFLDRETAKIDALVAKKERLIELLKEKRAALITHAVTKGLDPTVPMKDTGVEWLGQIPAHWNLKRVRHIVRRIEQGWSPDCENRQADEDEWGVLKAGCVNRGVFIESEHKALPAQLQPIPELEVRPGDLLMSRASGSRELVGSVAIVPRCRPRLLLCDKLFRLHVDVRAGHKEFLAYAMNARFARWQIEAVLSGGSGLANNIAQEVVKDLLVPQPEQEEKRIIAAFLDRETAKLDVLIAKVREGIERLKEYRTALISAAVTGKIDVRGTLVGSSQAKATSPEASVGR